MEKVLIGDREYELVFNMYTMELIEEKFDDAREIINRLVESPKQELKLCRELFVMLANTARELKGEPEDVTDEVLKGMNFEDYSKLMLRAKLIIEVAHGMRSETTGGNKADDTVHDAYLEEDEKNA